MRCWGDSFSDLVASGSLMPGVLIKEELVSEKIEELQEVWSQVQLKWGSLHLALLAHKQYQAWSRDHQISCVWLSAKEKLVSESQIEATLPEVESQIKKLDDLSQSLKTQETKIGESRRQ